MKFLVDDAVFPKEAVNKKQLDENQPMTTAGDLPVATTGGVPARLARPSVTGDELCLDVAGTSLAWRNLRSVFTTAVSATVPSGTMLTVVTGSTDVILTHYNGAAFVGSGRSMRHTIRNAKSSGTLTLTRGINGDNTIPNGTNATQDIIIPINSSLTMIHDGSATWYQE